MNFFVWIQFGFVLIMKFFMCFDDILCILISVIFMQVLWGGCWQSGVVVIIGEEVEYINSYFLRLGFFIKYMFFEGILFNFLFIKWC